MASACVNNSPAFSSYGWLSPRISFSHDSAADNNPPSAAAAAAEGSLPKNSPEKTDPVDFEFRLDDPVAMLPADELFSDGKLMPLHLTPARPTSESEAEIRSPEPVKSWRMAEITGSDPYVFSPKAPRCSSRWRELLGLKKLQNPKPELQKSISSSSATSKNCSPKSLKNFLHRNPKSSSLDSSLSLPLLRDSDSESVSISSSRLSLSSSSSSGPDHEDLPRLSLDSEKPSQIPIRVNLIRTGGPTRVRVARPVRRSVVEAESPRMNSSGKVVFNGGSLERSTSSPSSFNGGPRVLPRGMERSYSANVVRVSPVLNVPVCSLRGSGKSGSVFGFFSAPKKEKGGSSSSGKNSNGSSKMKSERSS